MGAIVLKSARSWSSTITVNKSESDLGSRGGGRIQIRATNSACTCRKNSPQLRTYNYDRLISYIIKFQLLNQIVAWIWISCKLCRYSTVHYMNVSDENFDVSVHKNVGLWIVIVLDWIHMQGGSEFWFENSILHNYSVSFFYSTTVRVYLWSPSIPSK